MLCACVRLELFVLTASFVFALLFDLVFKMAKGLCFFLFRSVSFSFFFLYPPPHVHHSLISTIPAALKG